MEATNAIDAGHSSTTSGSGARLGELAKTPTGIRGLDDVTAGGLPRGRSTLVCGPAGCGKTLLAMEFIVRGITQYNEPGVFVAFEETVDDLVANFASLGFECDNKLVTDHISVDRAEMEEPGDWDLDGLFVRIGAAIDKVGAKRVVIDTVETLFGAFSNTAVLTGSARQAQEAKERSDGTERKEDLEQRRTNLERRRESVEAQTATLWREFEDEADIVRRLLSHGSTSVEDREGQRAEQARLRSADTDKPEDLTEVSELPLGAS